jgi:hypothetical protein
VRGRPKPRMTLPAIASTEGRRDLSVEPCPDCGAAGHVPPSATLSTSFVGLACPNACGFCAAGAAGFEAEDPGAHVHTPWVAPNKTLHCKPCCDFGLQLGIDVMNGKRASLP